MAHQLEMRVAHQVGQLVLGASLDVVEAENIVAFLQLALARVPTQEVGGLNAELHGT